MEAHTFITEQNLRRRPPYFPELPFSCTGPLKAPHGHSTTLQPHAYPDGTAAEPAPKTQPEELDTVTLQGI